MFSQYMCKTCDPLGAHFWPQGHNLNKLGKGPLDDAICDAFCDFGACGGTTSSAENATLNDVNKF